MMAYSLNYQYFPKNRPNGRPLDSGAALLDHPVKAEELVLLPNVGDYVHVDNSVRGGDTFAGRCAASSSATLSPMTNSGARSTSSSRRMTTTGAC